MTKNDLKIINEKAEEFFLNENLDYFESVYNRLNIMAKNYDKKSKKFWHDLVDINKSLNIVLTFLKEEVPEYYDILLNILSFDNNRISFKSKASEKEKLNYLYNNKHKTPSYLYKIMEIDDSYIDLNGIIKIYYEKNIRDAFVILHEFIHLIDMQKDIEPLNKEESEVCSIAFEIKLFLYLVKNNIHKNDALNFIKDRFNYFYNDLAFFIYEYELLCIYEEKDNIDEQDYHSMFNVFENNDLLNEIILNEKKFIKYIKENGFDLPIGLRYLYGLIYGPLLSQYNDLLMSFNQRTYFDKDILSKIPLMSAQTSFKEFNTLINNEAYQQNKRI